MTYKQYELLFRNNMVTRETINEAIAEHRPMYDFKRILQRVKMDDLDAVLNGEEELPTPLLTACTTGSVAKINYLLGKGARSNVCTLPDSDIGLCVESRDKTCSIQFVDSGVAPVHAATVHGQDALEPLAEDPDTNFAARTSDGWTVVGVAAYLGRADVIRYLRKNPRKPPNQVDFNVVDSDGRTPALYAAEKGHSDCLLALHKCGVNLSDKHADVTAASIAAENGHVNCIHALHKVGADLSVPDSAGMTALYYAAQNGHPDCVTALAEYGADVEAAADDDWRPMHAAGNYVQLECLKALVAHGADPNSVTEADDAVTPLSLALATLYVATEKGDKEEQQDARRCIRYLKGLLGMAIDPEEESEPECDEEESDGDEHDEEDVDDVGEGGDVANAPEGVLLSASIIMQTADNTPQSTRTCATPRRLNDVRLSPMTKEFKTPGIKNEHPSPKRLTEREIKKKIKRPKLRRKELVRQLAEARAVNAAQAAEIERLRGTVAEIRRLTGKG